MSYSIRIVSSETEFASLQDAWDDLVKVAVDVNTFLTHLWLHTWWVSYRPKASLCILLCERDGILVGIAPMMVMRDGGAGRLFRKLRFVGDGTYETDHMNFIVSSDDRQEVLDELLQAIDRLPWDVAHINQIPEASVNAQQFIAHAAKRGWLISTERLPCPRRTLPSSFGELMASLPSRLRTTIRSSIRDLHKSHAVEFGYVQRQEELAEGLDVLFRNHAGRWQAKGQTGVFVDERKREFYARMGSQLLAASLLRFFHLKVDGRIVAQQFCFEHTGTVMLLQEGFDTAFANRNVGNVLRALVFEHLIATNTKVYDFLEGTSRHKQSWSDNAPCDLRIRACRASLIGRAAHHLPRLAAKLKRKLQPETVTAN